MKTQFAIIYTKYIWNASIHLVDLENILNIGEKLILDRA